MVGSQSSLVLVSALVRVMISTMKCRRLELSSLMGNQKWPWYLAR